MKIASAVVGSLLLAAVPLAAQAEDMSYRYIQLGYLETEIDGLGPDADGFGSRGSFAFANNFFVFTEISKQEVLDIDIDQYAVGLGGHYPLAANLDLVGRIGWARIEADAGGGFDAADDGYLAGLGVRARAGDHLQFEAGVVHVDFGSDANDTGVELAARYHFNKNWAAALEYQSIGDLATTMAAVRYSFGR